MNPDKSPEMTIEIVDKEPAIWILRLVGPLTLRTLFDLQEAARKDPTRSMLLDVAGVPYMDSAGLGTVISIFASCQRSQRGFGLFGVTDRIKTLLKITHVESLLPTFASEEAALAAVAKPGSQPATA